LTVRSGLPTVPDVPTTNGSALAGPGRRSTGARRAATAGKRPLAPILVRQMRGSVEESVHRGDVVEVDLSGRVLRSLGDPERLVNLRSAVKPFGLIPLLEAGGEREFGLEPQELAIMAGSHSGEDLHVRTLQALFRRTGITQASLGCGTTGMPLDALTATRLARDGEKPGPIRHMCSGQHSVFLLLSKLGGWSAEAYWLDDHPTQRALRDAVARVFRADPAKLVTSIDGCAIPTYAFPIRHVAWAYAILADAGSIPTDDPRSKLAAHLEKIRDAMLAYPEIVAGTRDRLDTAVMKAIPGRVAAKGGAEGLGNFAILRGSRGAAESVGASGLSVKIEDGSASERAWWAASIEALRQAGAVDAAALRALGRYHRPPTVDSQGRVAAEAIASFELAPVGELIR
jgi:L-asparaginase II